MLRDVGVERFVAELEALGYEPQVHGSQEVSFAYRIENGPRYGETVELGFCVPVNWPVEPPHGPCYRPAILRGTALPGVHTDGRHFGQEWDHWSRPFEVWGRTDRSVAAYLRHIRKLHQELPGCEEADAA
jgi:hypothetical protein